MPGPFRGDGTKRHGLFPESSVWKHWHANDFDRLAVRTIPAKRQERLRNPLSHVGCRRGRQDIPRLLQIGVAVAGIGLQIGPLGPFVPGVDEYQAAVEIGKTIGCVDDRVAQPYARTSITLRAFGWSTVRASRSFPKTS